MKKLILTTTLAIAIIALASYKIVEQQTKITIDEKTTVQEALKLLGDAKPNHTVNTATEQASATVGEELFKKGFSKDGGAKLQSKHFVCTSCHNTEREDPDLKVNDAQARLDYAAEYNLPFLQATTLYGAVDRRKFYNGDYYLKYGESVKKANNNLREAIQLCAVECSQGRKLDNWELESILAYLWTIGLKMSDLSLSDDDWQRIKVDAQDEKKHKDLVKFIKGFYLDYSAATFVAPPKDRKKGYDKKGNILNGKMVYRHSCKHCHENTRYSFFNLDDSKDTFKHLAKNFPKNNRYSLYYLIREGTFPLYGKRAYMPRYTKEKLTDQQIEDLRAYIEDEAKK
jgi:mono/diheme cytochrome c family protein